MVNVGIYIYIYQSHGSYGYQNRNRCQFWVSRCCEFPSEASLLECVSPLTKLNTALWIMCFFSGLQYVPKSTLHFNSNTPFSNIDTPQHSYVYMFDKGKNKHFPKPKHHVRSKYVKFSVGVRVYIYIYNRYIYSIMICHRCLSTSMRLASSVPDTTMLTRWAFML